MPQVKFVSGVKSGNRISDTSRKYKAIDPIAVEKAFNARSAGSSRGLDLFALREAMGKMLQSSGGRPALLGADAHVKIPKITSDWALLEKLANGSADLKHKPSPAQVAAMVLHLALGRIPEKDLEAATRREFA
ncbi:MAG: hypothetical protein ACKVQK_15750 [Burkholderiales bacterium]